MERREFINLIAGFAGTLFLPRNLRTAMEHGTLKYSREPFHGALDLGGGLFLIAAEQVVNVGRSLLIDFEVKTPVKIYDILLSQGRVQDSVLEYRLFRNNDSPENQVLAWAVNCRASLRYVAVPDSEFVFKRWQRIQLYVDTPSYPCECLVSLYGKVINGRTEGFQDLS